MTKSTASAVPRPGEAPVPSGHLEADHDWRRFRQLRAEARQRFAEESLSLALEITLDEDRDVAEREQALEALMQRRTRERRALFEDFNRQHLPLMLHTMLERGLIGRDQLTDLSLELRRALGVLG
jgi:hypothetical protein